MVRRIAAEDEIEFAIGERQALGGTVDRGHIAQTPLGSGNRHHIEHLLRQVVGHDFLDQRRYVETHVTGAATQVQDPGIALSRQFGL
ncbi:hypothetical protein D3C81_1490380 [compost metagenome]